jgi:hypothetical protein
MIFKNEYHCFIAGLPELLFDESKITTSILSFREELQHELAVGDYHSIHILFLPYDHSNLIQYLVRKEENLNLLGNYSLETFQDQIRRMNAILREADLLEPYFVRFIRDWYSEDTDHSALNPGLALATGYYNEFINKSSGFLLEWLSFDRDLKNIMSALVCRKHKLDPSPQMIGNDGIVPQLIKNNSRDFGLSVEFGDIEKIIQISEIPDLMEREKRLDQLRWEFIDEKTIFHYFDLDKIIAYFLKLNIVLRWSSLDKLAGETLFRSMLNTLEHSYDFPDDFKRKK